MASLIPGYNYDIFISYRQKDNKYDGWVTEFVDNLKKELESTFKEEISVYFDANPHDGLLETHDVNDSLKEKLKCLVFIPIISRTYCDPKSFAWEHEFIDFAEQASKDRFGLKVQLPSGNVASRVLPVRIYNLDTTDVRLCESVLGGVMRGVDFIYAEQGVNRPLKPDDDEKINLNKTKYRNQINKVGNAIQEIISGLLTIAAKNVDEKPLPTRSSGKSREEVPKEKLVKKTGWPKRNLLKVFAVSAIILLIIIMVVYPKISNRSTLDKLRSSGERITVTVMPFQNMTNDSIWDIWQDGIQNELISNLTNSEELKVRQTESINYLIRSKGVTDYSSLSQSVASNISKKLDSDVFIYGSIKQAGSIIRVNANLIDSKTEEAYKSFQIDGKPENILDITNSLSRLINNFLIINILKKQLPPDFQFISVSSSPEAYKFYLNGLSAFRKNDYQPAREWLIKAIAIDSTFYTAILQMAFSYGNPQIFDSAKIWCLRFYRNRDQFSPIMRITADFAYATYFETPYEEIKYIKQYLELDDKLPVFHWQLGDSYRKLGQWDKAIPEFEKSLDTYARWGIKSIWVLNYTFLGLAYHKTGQFKKEARLYKKAEEYFRNDNYLLYSQAVLSLSQGKTKEADDYIDKYINNLKESSASEETILTDLANIYADAGILNTAEEYFRKALASRPNDADKMNNLAYFLIDTERNIGEGMKLIDEVLASDPENFYYLHTRGWGLYKQGNYKEALDVLQKSWNIRREKAVYNHDAFLHLEAAKKAIDDHI
jgi:tetratricopeptide (TPR) repeat protein